MGLASGLCGSLARRMKEVRGSQARSSALSATSRWAAMRRAFELAEFDQAAALYDGADGAHVPYASMLLRARIYVKRSPDVALAFLLGMTAKTRQSLQRAQREMLLGMAYSRMRQHEAATERFDAAEGALRQAQRDNAGAQRELGCEIFYWRARDWVLRGEPERAARLAARVERGGSQRVRIRAWQLHSASLRALGRHREEAEMLIKVLDGIEQCEHPDIELRCWATHTLAALGRELHVPEARRAVEAGIAASWPEYFRENYFQATKAYAWTCALGGDYFTAFRYLKFAAKRAPGAAWAIVALLDRAYLAKCIGEVRWSHQELNDAEELLKNVAWENLRGEKRIALLLFAELTAPLDATKAASFMALYQRLAPLQDPLLGLSSGDRLPAMVDYAAGVVHVALGNRKQGLALLRKSLTAFDRAGYDWRAARCALAIYDVTRSSAMLEIAREKLREYAASWLMEDLHAREATSKMTGLTPTQESIFHDLCAGLSTDEISRKYGRSVFTVRNHVKAILTEFNVKTRAALVAEASRRGLT